MYPCEAQWISNEPFRKGEKPPNKIEAQLAKIRSAPGVVRSFRAYPVDAYALKDIVVCNHPQ
jgi:hypothetical protein